MMVGYIAKSDKMSYETLEKSLLHLPEPTNAKLRIQRLKYDNLIAQLTPYFSLEATMDIFPDSSEFNWSKPNKGKLLEIYKNSLDDAIFDKDRTETIITLLGVSWHLSDDCTNIELNPYPSGIKIACEAQEPEYILKMRTELVDSNVPIEMKIGNRNKETVLANMPRFVKLDKSKIPFQKTFGEK